MDETTQGILIAIVGAAAVALVTALFVWIFLKSAATKLVPVALLLVGFCLEIYFFKQPSMQLGLQIYPNDVISVFVLLAALVGFAYRPVPVHASPFLLWLGFGITIIASFVLGLAEFGRYAGTEVRPFFYLWVAGLYCCVADFSEADLKRIGRWCVWTCYALMGIALYFWIAVEVGWVNRLAYFEEPDTTVFRPVGAHAVLFTAIVGLVQTMAWLRGTGTRWSAWHAAALLAFTVVLQHRSVWIAAIAGLGLVLVLERRHLPRRFAWMLGFTMAATLIVGIVGMSGALDDLARRLTESTLSMDDGGGTFAARVDGWIRLLDTWFAASPQTWLFGFPFGKGYTRMYNGVIIEFAPHNYFIDLLLRVGIVGTLLFLLPTALAIVHGLRAKPTSEFDYLLTRGLAVALFVAIVYCIAYPSNYTVGAATGVALAHLIRTQRRERQGHGGALLPVRSPLTGQIIGWRPER